MSLFSTGGQAASCFCTGKCRTLGYCPANPPLFPDKWVKPRIRVKAWREPNEDNPRVHIAGERLRVGLRRSMPAFAKYVASLDLE